MMIEQERLPFLEGWRPPTAVINGFGFAQAVLALALATPEKTLFFGEEPPPTTHDVLPCEEKDLKLDL